MGVLRTMFEEMRDQARERELDEIQQLARRDEYAEAKAHDTNPESVAFYKGRLHSLLCPGCYDIHLHGGAFDCLLCTQDGMEKILYAIDENYPIIHTADMVAELVQQAVATLGGWIELCESELLPDADRKELFDEMLAKSRDLVQRFSFRVEEGDTVVLSDTTDFDPKPEPTTAMDVQYTDHPCWVGCGRPVPFDRAMCDEHWFRIPSIDRARLRAVWQEGVPVAEQVDDYYTGCWALAKVFVEERMVQEP